MWDKDSWGILLNYFLHLIISATCIYKEVHVQKAALNLHDPVIDSSEMIIIL